MRDRAPGAPGEGPDGNGLRARPSAPGDLRRLLRRVTPHAGVLLTGFVLGLLGALFELARPWPVKVIVDYALGGEPQPELLIRTRGWLPGGSTDDGLIAWSVAAAVAIAVLSAVVAALAVRLTLGAATRMVGALAGDVFAKLQRLSLSYHHRHAVGDLLQRTAGDVFVAQSLVTAVVIPAVLAGLTLLGMFAIMVSIDAWLSMVALAVVPLQILAFLAFSGWMGRTAETQWRTQGEVMALVENVLGAIKAVQGFSRERYFERRVRSQAHQLGDAYFSSALAGTAYEQTVSLINGMALAGLVGLGAVRVRGGQLSLGDLFVFIGYVSALYGPLKDVAQSVAVGVQVRARARRVFEVLDATEEVAEVRDPMVLGSVAGEVVFDGVTFGHEVDRPPVLQDVSFRVAPGEVVAIVGISGAGKTSLVSLLSRFADPWAGRVLLDGHDLRSLSLESLRTNVGLVLQEPYLLPVSVAENIAFGADVERSDVEAAAIAARADEFIRRLPQGYDTPLGERGVTLSGGERQRISIARALLADTPVLILDEPTSALDAATEREIFGALDTLIAGRTVLVVSHRLSTIRRATRIVTIHGGRVAEEGTHDSLMAMGGVYAGLYEDQHLEAW